MSSRIGGRRQRGIALIMSLIFLLLLAIAATALLDTVVWQNRLGVAQQQARDQFQRLHGAVSFATLEVADLTAITDSAKACEWETMTDSALAEQIPDGREVRARRLRVAYDCQETGNSESMCKPVEVAGVATSNSLTGGTNQIQGMEIVMPRLTDQRMATFSDVPEGSCE